MLNYELDPSVLAKRVPAGTDLDLWNGKCFVSMVGFRFLDTRVLGLPVPFHRSFEEVNLRFYVRREAADGARRGVVTITAAIFVASCRAIKSSRSSANSAPFSGMPLLKALSGNIVCLI